MTDATTRHDFVPAEDLEYDLAHDVPRPDAMHVEPLAAPRPSSLVSTATADVAGDYGYDLAHDIPKP
jgi:hypothetical protein